MPATTLALSPSAQLRIRRTTISTNGSILLWTPDGIWDCIACHQAQVSQYTESGWEHKYRRVFGLDDYEMVDVERENGDLKRFQYVDLKQAPTVNANKCTLMLAAERLEVIHFDWDNVEASLQLQVTDHVEGGKCIVEHTEYTSLLLHFEPVVFETVGVKRRAASY